MASQFSKNVYLNAIFVLAVSVTLIISAGSTLTGIAKGQGQQGLGHLSGERVVPIGIPVFIHPAYSFDPIRALKKTRVPVAENENREEEVNGQGQVPTTTTTTTGQPIAVTSAFPDVEVETTEERQESTEVKGQILTPMTTTEADVGEHFLLSQTLDGKDEEHKQGEHEPWTAVDPSLYSVENYENEDEDDYEYREQVDTTTLEYVTKKRQIPFKPESVSIMPNSIVPVHQKPYVKDMKETCRKYPSRLACRYYYKKGSWPLPNYLTTTTTRFPMHRLPWTGYHQRPTEQQRFDKKWPHPFPDFQRPNFA